MIKVKCRQCGKEIDKNAAILIKSKMYVCSEDCKSSYFNKTKTPAPMRQLTDYVQAYAPDTDWIRFTAQTKKMISDYGITPQGIQYTLWYIKCYLEKNIKGDGLSLVPFYYEEAKRYYVWKKKMKQNISEWEQKDIEIVVSKTNKEEDIFI
jgi:hypothetical protein